MEYVNLHGSILPAKIAGQIFQASDGKKYMFGSETSKRCRELRKSGILTSHKEGKFEVYTIPEEIRVFDSFFNNPMHQLSSLFPVDQLNIKA